MQYLSTKLREVVEKFEAEYGCKREVCFQPQRFGEKKHILCLISTYLRLIFAGEKTGFNMCLKKILTNE